jgi:hypothetical protein
MEGHIRLLSELIRDKLFEGKRLTNGVRSNFEFWNFTYTMPIGFVGTPNIMFDVELK